MPRRDAGYQLIEMLVAFAVSSLLLTLGIPPLVRFSAKLRVELAAAEVASTLRVARAYAIRHNAHVGVKFRVADGGAVSWSLHRDGDDDGVRTDDIDEGIDPAVLPGQRLAHFGRSTRLGFPPGPAPRDPSDPSRRLDRLEDPIRFNRSDIASFGHLGGATPGSVYITDGERFLAAVRLFGATGKVKVLQYDRISETWR
jgi:type II secretory pathway pseudopilin PulG